MSVQKSCQKLKLCTLTTSTADHLTSKHPSLDVQCSEGTSLTMKSSKKYLNSTKAGVSKCGPGRKKKQAKVSSQDKEAESCTIKGKEERNLLLANSSDGQDRDAKPITRSKRVLKRPIKYEGMLVETSPKKTKIAATETLNKSKPGLSQSSKKSLKHLVESSSPKKSKTTDADKIDVNESTHGLSPHFRKSLKRLVQSNSPKKSKTTDVFDVDESNSLKKSKRTAADSINVNKNSGDVSPISKKSSKHPKTDVSEGSIVTCSKSKTSLEKSTTGTKPEANERIAPKMFTPFRFKKQPNILKHSSSEGKFSSKGTSENSFGKQDVVNMTAEARSQKTTNTKPATLSSPNSCVVQFGRKAFLVNAPPSLGQLTPDKILSGLLPFIKKRGISVKEMQLKESTPTKKSIAPKENSPQEKKSMSGIEAILKAVEMMSTKEVTASKPQRSEVGECYLTYPTGSPDKDVSYKTVKMSNLESLELSKALTTFTEEKAASSKAQSAKTRIIVKHMKPKKFSAAGGGKPSEKESKTTNIRVNPTNQQKISNVKNLAKSAANAFGLDSTRPITMNFPKRGKDVRVKDPSNWQQFAVIKRRCGKCVKCSMEFYSSDSLMLHLKEVHGMTNPKSNKCTDCEQGFPTPSLLKRHQLLAHKISQDLLKPLPATKEAGAESDGGKVPPNSKLLPLRSLDKCNECKLAFPSADQLGDHLVQYHTSKVVFSDLILCELCDEAFIMVKDFLEHKRDVHSFQPRISRIGPKPKVRAGDDLAQTKLAAQSKSGSVSTNLSEDTINDDLLPSLQMTSKHCVSAESISNKTSIVKNDQHMATSSLEQISCTGSNISPTVADSETGPGDITKDSSESTSNDLPKSSNAENTTTDVVLNSQLLDSQACKNVIADDEQGSNLDETEKEMELFYCDVCNKHVRNLQSHILAHTGEKPFKCSCCRQAFTSNACLTIHLKLHTRRSIPFVCCGCGNKFTEESDFNSHTANCCKQLHKCSLCSRVFTLAEDLQIHETEHHEESHLNGNNRLDYDVEQNSKPSETEKGNEDVEKVAITNADHSYDTYNKTSALHNYSKSSSNKTMDQSFYRCKICGKVGTELRTHMMTHATLAIIKCRECNESFHTILDYEDHMLGHKGYSVKYKTRTITDKTESMHQCKYCPKKYLYIQSLHRHMVSHTGVYPHNCFVCEKGFRYPKELYNHVRTHKGFEDWTPERSEILNKLGLEPNISIVMCGADKSDIVELHSDSSLHVCTNCNLSFKKISNLTCHSVYKCSICGKVNRTGSGILEHMKEHSPGPHVCDVCESVFQTYTDLINHQKIQFHAKHQCPYCPKNYVVKRRLTDHLQTHNETKSYQCEVCFNSFRYRRELLRHKKRHEKVKHYKCHFCNKAFHMQTQLKSHCKWEHADGEPKVYMCTVCGKQSRSYPSLKSHLRTHSTEKPHNCEVCHKEFRSKTNRDQHMRVHSSDKPYKCTLCPKQYKSPNALKLHQHIHTGYKPYSCKICGKSFGEENKMFLHMRVHTGETPFECSMCDKRFSHKSQLNNHMDVHTGQKRFPCNVCDRSFNQKANLTIHQRIHTGERPLVCKYCGDCFRTSTQLKKHVRLHTGEKPFSCDVCSEAFMFVQQLRKHMKIHGTDSPYTCKKCRKIFVLKENLEKHFEGHLKDEEHARQVKLEEQEKKKQRQSLFFDSNSFTTHALKSDDDPESGSTVQGPDPMPNTCGICGSGFATVLDLNAHKTSHLLKPFQCAVCSEAFSSPDLLTAHLIYHVDSGSYDSSKDQPADLKAQSRDAKAFACGICSKTFTEQNLLVAHQKIHVAVGEDDTSQAIASITSLMSEPEIVSQQISMQRTSAQGPTVVVEYRENDLPTRQAVNGGPSQAGTSQESIVIEHGVSQTDQQQYITIQVPPDYNESLNDIISQATDYLGLLNQTDVHM